MPLQPHIHVFTWITPDGRRFWYADYAVAVDFDPATRTSRVTVLANVEVAAEVERLGAELAWVVVGPPTNARKPGPASSRCEPIEECLIWPPPEHLVAG